MLTGNRLRNTVTCQPFDSDKKFDWTTRKNVKYTYHHVCKSPKVFDEVPLVHRLSTSFGYDPCNGRAFCRQPGKILYGCLLINSVVFPFVMSKQCSQKGKLHLYKSSIVQIHTVIYIIIIYHLSYRNKKWTIKYTLMDSRYLDSRLRWSSWKWSRLSKLTFRRHVLVGIRTFILRIRSIFERRLTSYLVLTCSSFWRHKHT